MPDQDTIETNKRTARRQRVLKQEVEFNSGAESPLDGDAYADAVWEVDLPHRLFFGLINTTRSDGIFIRLHCCAPNSI